MKDKFQEATSELKALIPDVNESTWNYYRNISPIVIPVDFLKDNAPVVTAEFKCLGSPYQLNAFAIFKSMESLAEKRPGLEWDSLRVGLKVFSKAEAEKWLAQDLIVQSALASPDITPLNALLHLSDHLDEVLKSESSTPEDLKRVKENGEVEFITSVCLKAYDVTFSPEKIGAQVSRTLSHWKNKIGL